MMSWDMIEWDEGESYLNLATTHYKTQQCSI